MIKKTFKLLCAIFSVFLLLSCLYVPTAALSKNEAVFTLSDTDGAKKGDTVMVEITVDAGSGTVINGMDLSLSFESNCLTYINGSAKLFIETDNSPTVSVKNNKVNMAWDSGISTPLVSGKFATFGFKVEDISRNSEVRLNFGSCYMTQIVSGRVVYTDISVDVADTAMISGVNEDSAVNAVITAIDSIGTVTADSKAQLDLIYSSYNNLSQAQKQKVTNYDKLIAAIKECDALIKAEETEPVTAEIENYQNTYSEVMALRVSTVSQNDVERISAALDAMKKLSSSAQVSLLRTKYLLDSLLAKAKELKTEEDKKENEEKLKAEAQTLAEEYRNGVYKWVFSLTPDTVSVMDSNGVNLAYDELMNIEIINDIAFGLLAPEKKLLESLKSKIDELKLVTNPELSEAIVKANDFRDKFGFLFALNDNEITYDEKIDIFVAYELLNSYGDDVKEQLSSELARLEELISIAGDLEPEEETMVETVVNEVIKTETQIKTVRETQGLGNVNVDLKSRKMSLTAYILMGLCILAAILVAILRYAYYRLQKLYYPELFTNGGV